MCNKQRGVMGQTMVFGVRWCQESRERRAQSHPWHHVELRAVCGAWHMVMTEQGDRSSREPSVG